MTQLSQFDAMPEMPESAPAEPNYAMQPQKYSLKRMGKRPLSFEGTELCMAMSFHPKSSWWYEINIFRTVEQKFIVSVKQFFQSEEERDTARAWECDSFAHAMDILEGYDAADDVRVNVMADDPSLSLPELAAHALSLRARAEEARRQYQSLVGEILFDLEND